MSVDVIRYASGTARRCQSGGFVCDVSDASPTWVPGRDHAKAFLASRTTSQTTAMRRHQVGAVREAAATASPETN